MLTRHGSRTYIGYKQCFKLSRPWMSESMRLYRNLGVERKVIHKAISSLLRIIGEYNFYWIMNPFSNNVVCLLLIRNLHTSEILTARYLCPAYGRNCPRMVYLWYESCSVWSNKLQGSKIGVYFFIKTRQVWLWQDGGCF